MLANKLGVFVRKLRTAQGLTQKQLAEKLGDVSLVGTISQIERGVLQKPAPRLLKSLADFFKVDAVELFTRADYIGKREPRRIDVFGDMIFPRERPGLFDKVEKLHEEGVLNDEDVELLAGIAEEVFKEHLEKREALSQKV